MEQRAEEVHSFTLSGHFSSNLSCFSQQPSLPPPFIPLRPSTHTMVSLHLFLVGFLEMLALYSKFSGK